MKLPSMKSIALFLLISLLLLLPVMSGCSSKEGGSNGQSNLSALSNMLSSTYDDAIILEYYQQVNQAWVDSGKDITDLTIKAAECIQSVVAPVEGPKGVLDCADAFSSTLTTSISLGQEWGSVTNLYNEVKHLQQQNGLPVLHLDKTIYPGINDDYRVFYSWNDVNEPAARAALDPVLGKVTSIDQLDAAPFGEFARLTSRFYEGQMQTVIVNVNPMFLDTVPDFPIATPITTPPPTPKPTMNLSIRESMVTPRRWAASATVGSKIYVVSGATVHCQFSASNEVYNTATNSWATLAPVPLPRVGFAVVAHGNKLYAIAGSINCSAQTTKSLGIYDINSNSWTTGASMSQQRWLHGAAIVGDKIYVMGGQSGTSGIKLDTMEIYDIATNTWSFGISLLSGDQGRAAVIGSDIYFLGDDGILQRYDTLSGIWSFKASWPNPFNIVSGGLEVYQNKLYVVSPPHYNYPGDTPIDDIKVDMYDPATNGWSIVEHTTPWATPRDAFATGIVGNSLFIIGGCNDGASPNKVFNTNEAITLGE